ncbi:hypothetical protein DKP78_16145, partial [Enterococcus faecium]
FRISEDKTADYGKRVSVELTHSLFKHDPAAWDMAHKTAQMDASYAGDEVGAAYGYGYAEGMPMNGMHMEGDVPDDYAASIAYQYNEPY